MRKGTVSCDVEEFRTLVSASSPHAIGAAKRGGNRKAPSEQNFAVTSGREIVMSRDS